jgi:hypothetical protein
LHTASATSRGRLWRPCSTTLPGNAPLRNVIERAVCCATGK